MQIHIPWDTVKKKNSGKQAPRLDEKEIHLLTLDHLSNGKGIVGIPSRIRGTGKSHLFHPPFTMVAQVRA